MSSYIDHYRVPEAGEFGFPLELSWSEYTRDRLTWLYGETEGLRRFRMTDPKAAADLGSWLALGERSAA